MKTSRVALAVTLLLVLLVPAAPTPAADSLVAAGSVWKYRDTGENLGTAWRNPGYDDSLWASGPSELGYGDGGEATVVGYGPNASAKYITTYFRKTFNVSNPASYTSLALSVLRDDGIVVYLNGTEVYRSTMPAGAPTYTTLASAAVADDGQTWQNASLGTSALVAGTNTLAVEIHQANGTSTDISFNLSLNGNTGATVTRGPYLQVGTPSSIHVRWRTDAGTDSRVRYGTDPLNLNLVADLPSVTTEHEVTLTGLAANTRYYYSVGSSTATLAAAADQTFVTSPTGAKPTRIWVIGDAGTGSSGQTAVRDAYTAFTGSRGTDLWLMLGDNAYDTGTDAEFQSKVFNVYPTLFKQAVAWPAVGNHETAQSTVFDPTIAYYQSFTMPTTAEAGGTPSGTEAYYSFDYGNIHFVCLDSMTSSRSPGSAMLTWLAQDLAQNTREWVIAYWHHPPYSHGSHNSDTDTVMTQMRQNVNPILESYGVDLILSGHSHGYERSFLIDGFTGTSAQFNDSYKKDLGSGREDGSGAYRKATDGMAPHQGAIYTVAGSSGQVTAASGTVTYDHAAMYLSLAQLGSMVIDVDGPRMDVKFVRETGAVTDYFTMRKGNQAPGVSITAPSGGATYTAPATVTVNANASDPDGSIQKVDFYAGATPIGSDNTSPYSVTWSNVGAGTYSLTAVATDNLGATTTSTAVSITVNSAATPPAAPSALSAIAAGTSQINLAWTDNSGDEQSFRIERSTDGTNFPEIASVGAGVTTYSDTGLSASTFYWYRVRARNAAGDSDYSNFAGATTAAAAVPPAAPSSLNATSVTKTQVSLAWTDNSSNETGFKVYRAVNAGAFTLLTTRGANVTTYSDTSVSANKTYSYRVRSTNASGDSADSNTVSVTTPKK